jgi:hypothetical protein
LVNESSLEETKLDNKNGKNAWNKDTRDSNNKMHPNLKAKLIWLK